MPIDAVPCLERVHRRLEVDLRRSLGECGCQERVHLSHADEVRATLIPCRADRGGGASVIGRRRR